jgi:hypothetical protein
MSHDGPASKKLKTTGTPLYYNLDLNKLTFDDKATGDNEIRRCGVKYDGARLTFQLGDFNSAGALRVPFGIDDGSKFNNKPSMKFELPEAQRAFFQDQLESKIKDEAVANKATWFSSIKPMPDDDTIRNSFTSRIHRDESGSYPASLKVNITLNDEKREKLKVSMTRRLGDGKIANPKLGSPDDIVRGCYVVPVLRTAGGVWISVKKKTFEYGLIFEAHEMVVIEDTQESSALNFGDAEVVEADDHPEGGHGELLDEVPDEN